MRFDWRLRRFVRKLLLDAISLLFFENPLSQIQGLLKILSNVKRTGLCLYNVSNFLNVSLKICNNCNIG